MRLGLTLIGLALLAGCSPAKIPPVSSDGPSFLAYGITPDTSLPVDTDYSPLNPPVYMQPVTAGVLTLIAANNLYIGSSVNYNTVTSTWQPNVKGMYYIDEQVAFEGTYSLSTVTYQVQLNLNQYGYLWYEEALTVPAGQLVKENIHIDALICMNGTTDYVQAYASASQDNTLIISQESQFEGFYVGECQ